MAPPDSDTTSITELPSATHIGRTALRVASLDAVIPFYRDIVGFDINRNGSRARLLANDDPLVVLEETPDGTDRPADAAGLFHFAVRVPSRAALGDALERIRSQDGPLTGASDHLVSEALYLRDPEGNGVEIYYDTPRDTWTWADDETVDIDTLPLDLDPIAAEATGADTLPSDTDIGHVHLEVTDLPRAESFYVDELGFQVRSRYGNEAAFLAAGRYHHHIGLNTWNDRRSAAGGGRGLAWFEVVVPDHETRDRLQSSLADQGAVLESDDGALEVTDPDDITLRLVVE
ncbi:MAG: VOC family protein [Halobacteriales archaeon]